MDGHLRSPSEVADLLGVPKATVYKWQSDRSGPAFIKVGRHVRYRTADVEKWLDSHAVAPRPAA